MDMEEDRELARKIMAMAAAMTGPMVVRSLFLSGQEKRVAQTMRVAVHLAPRPPHGPSLPDVIDIAGQSIVSETENACHLAGLDDIQCETLMAMSQRGIEAFTKACGMAMVEEIRAGQLEPDWDAVLQRVDQILPKTLSVSQ